MEELVAELGSAFISADLDLMPELRGDHASYIASWIKVLRVGKRAIFIAASQAQRAADFLHELQKSASAQANAARASPWRSLTPFLSAAAPAAGRRYANSAASSLRRGKPPGCGSLPCPNSRTIAYRRPSARRPAVTPSRLFLRLWPQAGKGQDDGGWRRRPLRSAHRPRSRKRIILRILSRLVSASYLATVPASSSGSFSADVYPKDTDSIYSSLCGFSRCSDSRARSSHARAILSKISRSSAFIDSAMRIQSAAYSRYIFTSFIVSASSSAFTGGKTPDGGTPFGAVS
jgi:hypothetical protein